MSTGSVTNPVYKSSKIQPSFETAITTFPSLHLDTIIPRIPNHDETSEVKNSAYINLRDDYYVNARAATVKTLGGWRRTRMILCLNIDNRIAPLPRAFIYDEFQEFTKEQIRLFVRIFYSFKPPSSRFMRFEHLQSFMQIFDKTLDAFKLRELFCMADDDKNELSSVQEFLTLFRLANNPKHQDILAPLKDIAFSVHASDDSEDVGDSEGVVEKLEEQPTINQTCGNVVGMQNLPYENFIRSNLTLENSHELR